METGFGSKKEYTVYLKDYMKKVIKYLEENDMKDQVDGFKSNINVVMKELLGKFKDLQFFTGMQGSHNTGKLKLSKFSRTIE